MLNKKKKSSASCFWHVPINSICAQARCTWEPSNMTVPGWQSHLTSCILSLLHPLPVHQFSPLSFHTGWLVFSSPSSLFFPLLKISPTAAVQKHFAICCAFLHLMLCVRWTRGWKCPSLGPYASAGLQEGEHAACPGEWKTSALVG